MTTAELQAPRAFATTIPFGPSITPEQLPPLQGRRLEMPTVAQARLIQAAASAGLEEVRMLADLTDRFGFFAEGTLFDPYEPRVIYRAPAEQWTWRRREPVLQGFLEAAGIDAEHCLRNDVQTQGDKNGTIVYLLAHGGNDHLLVERDEIVCTEPQTAIERLWELRRLPAAPPEARRRERASINQRRENMALAAVNALSIREAAAAALALCIQYPEAPKEEIAYVLEKVDRRHARSTQEVVLIVEALRAGRAKQTEQDSRPKQRVRRLIRGAGLR